ncbi:MAG TPA: alpha/beta hydrolase-fold protein [Myxococcota bacterium]|jgi:hypothetical protein|nr:alpha/beta hydrolase-fold protein [Myxococcota bacterium]
MERSTRAEAWRLADSLSRRWRVWAAAGAALCLAVSCRTPASGGADGAANGSDAGSAGATDADSDSDAGAGGVSGDEAVFQAILAGARTAPDGVAAVALSGGWPIAAADGTFIFVHLDDAGGPYALAGDFTGWGTAPLPMTRAAGLWWTRAAVPAPAGAGYKYVDAGGAYAADPWARRYGYDSFGEMSFVAAAGAHLERWPGVGDAAVAARTLRVWVPAALPAAHALYVQDGQNLFDPAAPWGGWQLAAALGAGTMVIGLDNTPARMDEYTHVEDFIGGAWVGGAGDAYADYVTLTVRPFVEARYGAAARSGVMGSSLGGLIAFHEAERWPGTWDFAASLSGTFGWGSIGLGLGGGTPPPNETLIDRFGASAPADLGGTVLYLDSGGGPGSGCADADGDGTDDDTADATDNYCETWQLAQTLAARGWTWDADLFHWWEPGATHDEAAWAARVWRPVGIFEGL